MLTGMGPGSYWDENGIILGWDRDPGRIRPGSHQDGTGGSCRDDTKFPGNPSRMTNRDPQGHEQGSHRELTGIMGV